MGEFHDAVTKLLGAFSCGLSMIKAQRRKYENTPSFDASSKKAEGHLSKSLEKNRLDVENAYGQDLVRCGPRFAVGDAEAHSSLSKILFRLNTVIKRFTTGRQRTADYQALLNLSNASRVDAINTFEQLSHRISRSSLPSVPSSPEQKVHRPNQKKSSSTSSSKHSRSKSAPDLMISSQGWVRPKAGRKRSGDSIKTSKSPKSPPRISSALVPASPGRLPPVPQRQMLDVTHTGEMVHLAPPPNYASLLNRKSNMSFMTDSTKLGEIPEHKWARTARPLEQYGMTTTYYPLQPYQEPDKPRSRLRRLFRR